MTKNDYKNYKTDSEPISKLFKNEEDNIKINTNNCLIYGEKSDFINEDIFFKEKEAIDCYYLDKHKPSIDLNLSEKNLHDFFNDDLIKALDNDLMDPEEKCDKSDSSSSNAYISESSNCSSQFNSPEPNDKHLKNGKEIINVNLNKETCVNRNLNDVNKNKIQDAIIDNSINIYNKETNIINKQIEKEDNRNNIDNIDINMKDKINMLNNPLFAPIINPNKENVEIEEEKQKEEKEHKKESKKEKRNNSLKNKFDDDVEPIIMLSMTNMEEKTKLPLEIRVGDWICLYCNNLNFSFRIKCNRCGLLRKSSTHLLKKKYYSNKYQYMGNYNNYDDSYNMNFNNNNYELNFNNNYNNNL